MDWLKDLFSNPFLLTSLGSWFVAQVLKTIIHLIIYKKMDWQRLYGDGGMPSGHSATVSSLATMCGLSFGFGSVEFAITAVLAIIVCHDATGVRRETGRHAEILNELLKSLELKIVPISSIRTIVFSGAFKISSAVFNSRTFVCSGKFVNLIFVKTDN